MRAWIEVEWDGDSDAGRSAIERTCDLLMETLVDEGGVLDPAVSVTLAVPEPVEWVLP